MEFCNKTKICMGALAEQALQKLGTKRLLLVTDPYFGKNGTAQALAVQTNAQYSIFSEVAPDPSAQLVAKGIAQLQKFQPDMVVALGGGSAMDCAKAMIYLSESNARLVAIPTTSGSGSEVTDFAIITAQGTKQVLVDERLRPEVAILDDSFLQELPRSLVADGGFDVLAHALEALASTGANAITDALAMDSFCTVFSLLERSFRGERGVRLRVHVASTMAGLAFSGAGLGLCHGISHALGGLYHLPHGRLNAILLPAVVEANAPAAGEKYASLARRAGLGGSARVMGVRNLRSGLVRLRKALQLPQTLVQAGITLEQIRKDRKQIVETVLKDPCCRTNPVPVTPQLVERVLDEVMRLG